MDFEIAGDTENGQLRLESELDCLASFEFERIDVTLKRETFMLGPDDRHAELIRHWTTDIRTGKRRPVPINDRYSLIYRLQPSGKELAEHKIADRDYHYADREGFEEEVHHQVGLILEAIREKCPSAEMSLQLPDDDKPRQVDEAVIEELKGSLDRPIAVVYTTFSSEWRDAQDRLSEELDEMLERLRRDIESDEKNKPRE